MGHVEQMRNIIIRVLTISMFTGNLVAEPFYVNYSKVFDVQELSQYNMAIISPDAALSGDEIRRSGTKLFAYLSIGEVASDAPYRLEVERLGFNMQSKNQTWGSAIMDPSDPKWRSYLVDSLAVSIASKGFSGFFLDTVDSYQFLIQGSESRKRQLESGVIQLVKALKQKLPHMDILLNRGFDICHEVTEEISGVLAESLFHTYNFSTKQYGPTTKNDQDWLLGKLVNIQKRGTPVFIIDYALPEHKNDIQLIYDQYESLGFNLCVTNVEINGIFTQPRSLEARHVLTIFGNKSTNPGESVHWPSDSLTASTIQMPGEYLGLEFSFHNIAEDGIPENLSSQFKAIIVDANLQIPPEMEQNLLHWLIQEKNKGRRIVIWGQIPFSVPSVKNQFLNAFNFQGTGNYMPDIQDVKILKISPDFNFESKSIPGLHEFIDLRAPIGSRVALSYQGKNKEGPEMEFHPVFYSDWGAFVYLNKAIFKLGDEMHSWCMDPFQLIQNAIEVPNWPVPDTTSRNGLRILYSHIDGDGFGNLSAVSPGKRSSEVILEKTINKYPYYFTSSIIESEIRGLIEGQDKTDMDELISIARKVFSSPNVEAASHTFSHPFYWKQEDSITADYANQTLPLKSAAGYTKLDLRKEIHAPIRFIEDFLMPENKNVKMILWSGNCRIPAEAIQMVQSLGIQNMNGGETTISRNNPSLLKVAPKLREIDGQLQIHSSIQSDNVYRRFYKKNGIIPTAYYSGYENVLQTFRYTESPRRLKPVNVYFHWFSGDNWASLKAVETVLDWCQKRNLSAITASQFAQIVEDSRKSKIYKMNNDNWIITNNGACRTFRINSAGQVPDIENSINVTGFNHVNGELYIQLGKLQRTVLRLTAHPKQYPYFDYSTGDLELSHVQKNQMVFQVKNITKNRIKTSGWEPGKRLRVRVNGDEYIQTTDPDGSFEMTVADVSEISIQQ